MLSEVVAGHVQQVMQSTCAAVLWRCSQQCCTSGLQLVCEAAGGRSSEQLAATSLAHAHASLLHAQCVRMTRKPGCSAAAS